MFFRNVWKAAELTNTCKAVLLRPRTNHLNSGRQQLRNSWQNTRRPRRPALEPDPLEGAHIDSGPLYARSLIRPFFFTVGVSSVTLAGCVIWEYENLRSHASNLFRRPSSWLSAHQKRLLSQYKSEPGPIKKWWNSLKESEKVFYPILAANVLVFGAWRVRALQPIMVKFFCSNPSGRTQCLPMIFSAFSHYSPLHLAANMYVLYSFMPAAVAALGKEQFVAMYLSAGVISSFASFLYKVVANQPGLSLGASGAIMAVLSYVCLQYPDTKLSIIFLPMYTFAAGTVLYNKFITNEGALLFYITICVESIIFLVSHAIKFIMGIDLAGVIFGWKFFDHAAHLGGALFGLAWCHWGGAHIWGNRDKFVQYYHTLRNNDSGR